MSKLCIERKRYVILTADKKEIFCGLAKHYQFKNIEDIGDTAIKTYLSEKKAKSSFLSSWWNVKENDFEEGGRFIVVPVIEKIEEI